MDFRRCGNVSIVPDQMVQALRMVVNYVTVTSAKAKSVLAAASKQNTALWRIKGLTNSLECVDEAESSSGLCAMRWLPR